MLNRIGSIIPMGFVALYAMLAVIVLPIGLARAADDCLTAPNTQPPQGSHWYYRIDGATQRHCWYLGPEGQKVHHAEPEVQPAAKSATPLRTENGGDRPMASAQVEPPLPPLRPATAANATAQAGVQRISQGASQSTPSTVQWPDPQQPAGASDREAGGPSTLQYVNAEDEMVQPAASAAHARTNMPIWVTLLVASALAVAGLFQQAIFKIMIARRRRIYVEVGRAERSVSRAPERMPQPFAASRPNGLKSAPVEHIDPRDIEEGFRQILRALERQAA
jgi:hypothetical protein